MPSYLLIYLRQLYGQPYGFVTLWFTDQAATLDISDIDDHIDVWCPCLELSLPHHECRQRHDEQEWPVDVIGVHQHREECNHLNGLAESHLVSQDHAVLSTQMYNAAYTGNKDSLSAGRKLSAGSLHSKQRKAKKILQIRHYMKQKQKLGLLCWQTIGKLTIIFSDSYAQEFKIHNDTNNVIK